MKKINKSIQEVIDRKAKAAVYRNRNREKIREQQREYRERNKEKMREYHKQYMRAKRAEAQENTIMKKRAKQNFGLKYIPKFLTNKGRTIKEKIVFSEKDLVYIKSCL